jgi:trk system potassium uptake protein TrkH
MGIRPSIVRTSRRILGIAITFLILGTVLFTLAGMGEGQKPGDAFFDGLNHSMTAYATGGFSTHSQNLLYYHSSLIEVVALILMILGSLNFNLHYAVLTGRRREMLRDIEVRFFILSMLIGGLLVGIYLSHSFYPSTLTAFRKGFFHLVSAQTTTGFQTVPSSYIMYLWPVPVLVVLSALMIIGGSANSTSGGIKNLRMGILFKSLLLEIRKTFLPSSAVAGETYYHLGKNPITEVVIRGAAVVALSYLLLLGTGTLVTASLGYPLGPSLFESASALANTGLSCGITSPSMPAVLKLTYIFLMWAGRLEIIAIFVLFGFILLQLRRALR